MTEIRKLHEEWMKDPQYRAEFEALEDEFSRYCTDGKQTGESIGMKITSVPDNAERRS